CISGVDGSRNTRITGRPSGHLWLSNLKTLVRSAAVIPPVLLVLSTITASCLASEEAPRLATSKSKTQIRLPILIPGSLCRNLREYKITVVIGALIATGYGIDFRGFCRAWSANLLHARWEARYTLLYLRLPPTCWRRDTVTLLFPAARLWSRP